MCRHARSLSLPRQSKGCRWFLPSLFCCLREECKYSPETIVPALHASGGRIRQCFLPHTDARSFPQTESRASFRSRPPSENSPRNHKTAGRNTHTLPARRAASRYSQIRSSKSHSIESRCGPPEAPSWKNRSSEESVRPQTKQASLFFC